MNIAIFSDVHSNLQALQAVLADIAEQEIDQIISLGDVVGYGANPVECLDLVMSDPRIKTKICGNHEKILSRLLLKGVSELANIEVNPLANAAFKYSFAELGRENIEKFRDWLEVYCLDDLSVTLAHGALSSHHVFRYIKAKGEIGKNEMRLELDLIKTQIGIVGHTHQPVIYDWLKRDYLDYSSAEYLDFQDNSKYFLNVGSVGQPRDGNCHASYGILMIDDTGQKKYQLRRVEYDVAKARKAIIAAGLPRYLGDRLLRGE
jgi:predicted phosphodiesterase